MVAIAVRRRHAPRSSGCLLTLARRSPCGEPDRPPCEVPQNRPGVGWANPLSGAAMSCGPRRRQYGRRRFQRDRSSAVRIVVSEFMSLDGVVQAPGGPEEDLDGGFTHGGWSMPFFDPEVM